jgi:hypothetical protein
MRRFVSMTAAVAVLAVALAACGSGSSSGSGGGGGQADVGKATTLAEAGGMDALVAVAKKEGTLNTITLPAYLANYGTIIKNFQDKYGIKVGDANPDGRARTRSTPSSSSRARTARRTCSIWAVVRDPGVEGLPARAVQGGPRSTRCRAAVQHRP